MKEFRTTLLREKFTILEQGKHNAPLVALSNRIVVPLVSADGIDNETFVVRTQNMHSCARMAAAMIKEFVERGTLASRAIPVPWKEIWGDVIKGYERDWNPDIWIAIYHRGRPVFAKGNHHPFIDIIEQCDIGNKEEYAKSLILAQKAFSQAGKKVDIDHKSNVALVVSCKEDQAKCGIIVRAATGTTTFNYTAVPDEDKPRPIYAHTTLSVAASFLEAIQLAFQVGTLNKKQQFNLYTKGSEEERRHKRANIRLGNLSRAISDYETNFKVTYRPERPTIQKIIDKAENHASKTYKNEIEEKIREGDFQSDEWVM